MTLPNYAYFKGEIVPYKRAKVGVLNHSLNYGTAAFGGLRAYWNNQDEEECCNEKKDKMGISGEPIWNERKQDHNCTKKKCDQVMASKVQGSFDVYVEKEDETDKVDSNTNKYPFSYSFWKDLFKESFESCIELSFFSTFT